MTFLVKSILSCKKAIDSISRIFLVQLICVFFQYPKPQPTINHLIKSLISLTLNIVHKAIWILSGRTIKVSMNKKCLMWFWKPYVQYFHVSIFYVRLFLFGWFQYPIFWRITFIALSTFLGIIFKGHCTIRSKCGFADQTIFLPIFSWKIPGDYTNSNP